MAEAAVLEQTEPWIRQPNEAIISAGDLVDRFEIEAQAALLIERRHQIPESAVLRQEYKDNARTALMEALTASGHLSRVEIDGSLEAINRQVLSRLINGWDDNLPAHEKKRRFAELCEELTIQEVHRGIVKGLLPANTAVGVLSDCPTVVMEGIGYRYSNRKGMVRSTHLRQNADGSFTRIIEQVSRSNSVPQTSFGFLLACGIVAAPDQAPDIAALNAPFIYNQTDLVDGAIDIQRRLDSLAGPNVIYGDLRTEQSRHVDYHMLRQESARREAQIECYIDGLATLEAYLDQKTSSGEVSRHEAMAIFKNEVERILDAICTLAPEYAEATFGQAVAPVYYQMSDLVMRGEFEAAEALRLENNHLKDTITFCGMSISIEEAQKMGLPVNEYGELVKKGKENWPWKMGVCRVEVCPTRPGKTEVGPCSVCRSCQFLFNRGRDPTKFVNLRTIFAIKKPVPLTEPKPEQPTGVLDQEDSTIKTA